jgi:hypothetical protein
MESKCGLNTLPSGGSVWQPVVDDRNGFQVFSANLVFADTGNSTTKQWRSDIGWRGALQLWHVSKLDGMQILVWYWKSLCCKIGSAGQACVESIQLMWFCLAEAQSLLCMVEQAMCTSLV